jgi:malonate transporter
MIAALADALVPIFVGLLAGFVAGRRGLMDNVNVRNLIVLVMDFAVPCSLFLVIGQTPRTVLQQQLLPVLCIAVAFCGIYAAVYVWARLQRCMPVADSAILALTIGFPNTAAVALPLFASAYGPSAAITAALSIVIGSVTIAPVSVALIQAGAESMTTPVTFAAVVRKLPQALLRPVVWAPLLATISVFLHLSLPAVAQHTLNTMGSAATGSALLLTGVAVSAQQFRFSKPVLMMTVVKLVVQPLLALVVCVSLRMGYNQIRNITVLCAIPAGFFGLVFGKEFDDTPAIASSSLIATYVAGAAILALWMILFRKLA